MGRSQLRLGVKGLYYADEHPADRDALGVLWARTADAPGRGRPQYSKVNGLRQRETMLRLRCQVCAGPASRTSKGTLLLLEETVTDPGELEDDIRARRAHGRQSGGCPVRAHCGPPGDLHLAGGLHDKSGRRQRCSWSTWLAAEDGVYAAFEPLR